jgi:conjugative transfer signal peptidase TraF
MTRQHTPPTSGTHIVVSCATTVCLGGLVLATLASHLVVNSTPSDRLGLYWRRPLPSARTLRHGERVVLVPPVWVQDALRRVAPQVEAARPWMKTIAAVAGETVCLDGESVTINGAWRAARPLLQDYALTAPQGCLTLPEETYFVLNDHPRSFDSRYVGAIARAAMRGTVTPLYTWEASR